MCLADMVAGTRSALERSAQGQAQAHNQASPSITISITFALTIAVTVTTQILASKTWQHYTNPAAHSRAFQEYPPNEPLSGCRRPRDDTTAIIGFGVRPVSFTCQSPRTTEGQEQAPSPFSPFQHRFIRVSSRGG